MSSQSETSLYLGPPESGVIEEHLSLDVVTEQQNALHLALRRAARNFLLPSRPVSYGSSRLASLQWLVEAHHLFLTMKDWIRAAKLLILPLAEGTTQLVPLLNKWSESQLVITLCEPLLGKWDPLGEAWLWEVLGSARMNLGELEEARTCYLKSLEISQKEGFSYREMAAIGNLGSLYAALSDYPNALKHHQQGRKLAKELDEPLDMAVANHCIGNVYMDQGHFRKALEIFRTLLKAAKKLSDKELETHAMTGMGIALASLGDFPQAEELQQKARALAQANDDPVSEMVAVGNLATLESNRGNPIKALQLHQLVLRSAIQRQELQDELGELIAIGGLNMDMGRYQQADAYLCQARAKAQSSGYVYEEGMVLISLGKLRFSQGALAEAETLVKRAEKLGLETGSLSLQARPLGNLTDILKARGEWKEVETVARRALALFGRMGDQVSRAKTLLILASVAQARNDLDRATAHAEKALTIAEITGERYLHINALTELGGCFAGMSRHVRAKACFEEAVQYARDSGYHQLLVLALNNLGGAALALDQMDEAAQWFEESAELAASIGDLQGRAEALCNLGSLLLIEEQLDTAHTLLHDSLLLAIETGFEEVEAAAGHKLGVIYFVYEEHDRARQTIQRARDKAARLQLPLVEDSDALLEMIPQNETGAFPEVGTSLGTSLEDALRLCQQVADQETEKRPYRKAEWRAVSNWIQSFDGSALKEKMEDWQGIHQAIGHLGCLARAEPAFLLLHTLKDAAMQVSYDTFLRDKNLHQVRLQLSQPLLETMRGEARQVLLSTTAACHHFLGEYAACQRDTDLLAATLKDQVASPLKLALYRIRGNYYHATGKLEKSLKYHRGRLILARKLEDFLQEIDALGDLGIVLGTLSQFEDALVAHEMQWELANESDEPQRMISAAGNFGNSLVLMSRYDEALPYFRQCYALAVRENDTFSQGAAMNGLAVVYKGLGDMVNALRCLDHAEKIGISVHHLRTVMTARGNQGSCHLFTGDITQATRCLEGSLEMAHRLGDQKAMVDHGTELARAYVKTGKVKGVELLKECTNRAGAIHYSYGQVAALFDLGGVYARAGEHQEAFVCWLQGLFVSLNLRIESLIDRNIQRIRLELLRLFGEEALVQANIAVQLSVWLDDALEKLAGVIGHAESMVVFDKLQTSL